MSFAELQKKEKKKTMGFLHITQQTERRKLKFT